MKTKTFLTLIYSFFLNFTYAEELQMSDKTDYVDCQNVFHYQVFDNYTSQLYAFVNNLLNNQPQISKAILAQAPSNEFQDKFNRFVALITEPFNGSQIQHHQAIILTLRELLIERDLIKNKDLLTESYANFLDEFCLWMYTGPNLNGSFSAFLFNDIVPQFSEIDQHFDLAPSIDMIFASTLDDQRFQSTDSRKGTLDDSHLLGDLPSYLYTLPNEKQTVMIRTSTIARDHLLCPLTGKTTIAVINEEFKGYLKALSKKNQKHLYVNLMSRNAHEQIKSNLIEDLEIDPEVGSSIYVVTLEKSKADSLYMQKDHYEMLSDSHEFKKAFYNEMTQENGSFYWSSHLDKALLFVALQHILDDVHATYFQNKASLTKEERMAFVELAYIAFIDKLVEMIQPDYMNSTCRYSLDRGPSIFTLYYLYNLKKYHLPIEENYTTILSYLFSLPILMHNRPCHTYRIERFQNASNYILANTSH